MPELLRDIRIILFLYVNTAFKDFFMAIRCIDTTAIFMKLNRIKSMGYKIMLFFLLGILFWVGRNEQ
jgi:hypothetical protein